MPDILHRFGVEAPSSAVYSRLATTDGLQQWWTNDVRGSSAVGDRVSFHFGGPDRFFTMQVLELEPDKRVAWRCVDGPPEWIDTDVTFELSADDDETVIMFGHRGWREPVDFMNHCSSKWASYLFSLKDDLERGDGRPFPNDVHVSRWD